jgi:hypothetical protein
MCLTVSSPTLNSTGEVKGKCSLLGHTPDPGSMRFCHWETGERSPSVIGLEKVPAVHGSVLGANGSLL